MRAREGNDAQRETANGIDSPAADSCGIALAEGPPPFVVRVTLTVEIPYADDTRHPGVRDATERVIAALGQGLPAGARLHGYIDTRVRTAKEVVADAKRAERRRKERYG